MRLIFLALLLPAPALAECPVVDEHSDERAELHTRLLAAPDAVTAQAVANALWSIWTAAPDSQAQALLDRGMERRQSFDLEASESALDDLVAYCPDYAEGYNQRAFTRFMRHHYDAALEDIDRTLELNPYHFGALSGKALTLMRQGRVELAQEALRRAVSVHPYLQERHMLVEPPDKDI